MTRPLFRVHNVRMGFATNSSSSHSIIFPATKLAQETRENYDLGDTSFGWNEFVLKSAEAKRAYLAATIHSQYYELPQGIRRAICKDWLNVDAEEMDVDHQSRYTIPTQFGTELPDEQFVREFSDFLSKEEVVVVGGNDNSDKSELNQQGGELPIPIESSNYTCRKDRNYWTLFSKTTGAKIRFSFHADKIGSMIVSEPKPKAPELVDVKITDFCPYNCAFCYMNSTLSGKHADKGFLYNLARELGQAKVFEVAIGGGEPTLHPEFKEIVETFKRHGVIVNFTTKNLEWIRNLANALWVKEHVGAIAYSVTSPSEVKKLAAVMTTVDMLPNKVVIQAIIGPGCIDNVPTLHSLLTECSSQRFALTLLGYKTTGRGAEFEKAHPSKQKNDWWLDAIIEWKNKNTHSSPAIGIDSVLAKSCEKELVSSGISRELFYTSEGVYSCYVDAVEKKIGPSSFAPDKMIPLANNSWNVDLVENFQKISRK